MKLNNFWTRIISGISLIIITFGLFYAGPWGLAIFATIIAVIGMHEFFNLVGIEDANIRNLSMLNTGGLTLAYASNDYVFGQYLSIGIFSFIVAHLVYLWRMDKVSFKFVLRAHIYLTLPMQLLQINARDLAGHYDFMIPLFLMVLVWSSDSWAYVSGKLLGKHKLAPSISPGKTWEGLIGGSILTAVTAYYFSYFLLSQPSPDAEGLWFHETWTPIYSIFLGLLVAVFGTMGDLFASSLKREAGVKDSGNLIPGHGGILDRFDAFIFAIFVMNLLG